MLGRWFFLAVVGIGVIAYMKAPGRSVPPAEIAQACSATPGAASVTFSWKAPGEAAYGAFLDLSLTEDFLPGFYAAHGPLGPAQTIQIVDGLPLGLEYHYRVNVAYAEGWKPVARGSFTAACGAEETASRAA